ncbi:MAG: PilZ domain-containing protein [Candidatus Omnitrophica bacterium]|nr:PilZ domain-containing protein [Candidatus Omnitrophota bacterium]MBU4334072.1 PilZ domain-containing protein [Candidatus Omnitrophota bacterium]
MVTAKENIKDKRLFERFIARFPAKIKDSRQDFGSKVSLKDASAQGARFSFVDKVFLNDTLTIEVDLPKTSLPVALKGDVVWTRMKEDRTWDVGMKFSKIRLMLLSQVYEMTAAANR